MEQLTLTESLLKEILSSQQQTQAQVSRLSGVVEELGKRIDRLDERLTSISRNVHEPPCVSLRAMDTRVTAIERWMEKEEDSKKQLHGRFSNLFWQATGWILTTALGATIALVVAGFKVWNKQ